MMQIFTYSDSTLCFNGVKQGRGDEKIQGTIQPDKNIFNKTVTIYSRHTQIRELLEKKKTSGKNVLYVLCRDAQHKSSLF